jgi:predicted transcriptional regulator
MLPELSEIKKRRRHFSMTQSELADLCGVSQSLMAKIESGKLVPSYDKAKRIFDMLESLRKEKGLKAREIMSRNVLYATGEEPLPEIIRLMSKNGISQLPVLRKGLNEGTVSERAILTAMREGKDVSKLKAGEVMGDAMPSVTEESPSELVSSILEYAPAVAVKKAGKVTGIITKADLLKSAVRGKKRQDSMVFK